MRVVAFGGVKMLAGGRQIPTRLPITNGHGRNSFARVGEESVDRPADGVGNGDTASFVQDSVASVSWKPRQFAGALFRQGQELSKITDKPAEEKANRLQLAASATDKKIFDILKDDPDLEVRLAFLKNANFGDQPWFQEFKNLYEAYKRLQTIALGSFATKELDSLKTNIDLRKIVPEFEKLLPIVAKLEPEPRIRYAVALNQTLTNVERALFAGDSFLPIHRKLGTKKEILKLYDLIKKFEQERAWTETKKEQRIKELKAWSESFLNEKDYAKALAEIYQSLFFEQGLLVVNLEEYYLPCLPIPPDQIETIYRLASDYSKVKLMEQKNLPVDLADDFAQKFKEKPNLLLALAKSPHINIYYDQLASLSEISATLLIETVLNNPATSAETIRKIVKFLGYVGEGVKALLLKHKNTPLDLGLEYTKDVLAFRRLTSNQENADILIEEIYLSKDFTSAQQKERLAILQEEMGRYFEGSTLEEENWCYIGSRYAPRERLKRAILNKTFLKRGYDIASVEAVISKRADLTKEELKILFKAIPEQTLDVTGDTATQLFKHPNLDSKILLEAVEHVAKIRKRPHEIAHLQSDLMIGFLSYHPADSEIKKYVYKKLDETEGTDQFSYYVGILFMLAGENLDVFEPASLYSRELKFALVSKVSMATYFLALGEMIKRWSWTKGHDIALGLWEKIKTKGLANSFLKALPYDPTKNFTTRLVIAQTSGLDPEFYAKALKEAMRDKEKNLIIPFREALWKNPSVPSNVLIQSKAIVETLDQAVTLSEALQKRGLPNLDLFLKFKGRVTYWETLELAKIMREKGYPDAELDLMAQMDDILTKEKEEITLQKLKEIYSADPKFFLAVLDKIASLAFVPASYTKIMYSDFLPDGYIKKYFYSFEPGAVRLFSGRKDRFNEVFLSDTPPYLKELLKGKSVFTHAFILTLLSGLPLDETRRGDLEKLIGSLESVELFDNSFLEYYLASQTMVVKDAFLNSTVPDDQKYPLLLKMVGLAKKDVDGYGKVGDEIFFTEGRKRLVKELLKHSVFAARAGDNLNEKQLQKWEIFLQLGIRGLAHFVEYQEAHHKTKIEGKVDKNPWFPALTQEKLPEYLKRDFHKTIYIVSERIKQYLASPNREGIRQMGLQKENAFYSEGKATGDFSLVGGLTAYGNNIEGSFYAELGHHYSEHVFTMEQLKNRFKPNEEKMNAMALYEFDDRMALATIPPSLEDSQTRREALDCYFVMDHQQWGLGFHVLSLEKNQRDHLLAQLEKIGPEKFSSRKRYYLFANALRVLKAARNGVPLNSIEKIILGEGLYWGWKEGLLQFPKEIPPSLLGAIATAEEKIEKLPLAQRVAIEGGNFLSTYGNAYSMNGVPLRPIIPEKLDAIGMPDFSNLNWDEQHLTAEWLVYYSKRHARSLLMQQKIGADEYFYFLKNIPVATKLLLKEKKGVGMTDVVAKIRELTPEKLGRLIIEKGLWNAPGLERENRWIRRLEEKSRNNPDWTLEKLEAEIARTRRLY